MESVVSNSNGTPCLSFRSDEPDSSYIRKEQTLLVFELSLLLLFSSCIHYSSHTSVNKGEERYDIVFPKYKKGGYKVVQDAT